MTDAIMLHNNCWEEPQTGSEHLSVDDKYMYQLSQRIALKQSGIKKIEEAPISIENINEISSKDIQNYFLELYIKGKEITVGLAKQDDDNTYVFPILGINPKNEIYDYEAKYTPGKTEMEMPAKLSKEMENKVVETCKKAYRVLGCSGLSRIDAIVGDDNEVYLMEVNTQGGMTNTSDIPAMAKHVNLDFNDLVLYILGLLK